MRQRIAFHEIHDWLTLACNIALDQNQGKNFCEGIKKIEGKNHTLVFSNCCTRKRVEVKIGETKEDETRVFTRVYQTARFCLFACQSKWWNIWARDGFFSSDGFFFKMAGWCWCPELKVTEIIRFAHFCSFKWAKLINWQSLMSTLNEFIFEACGNFIWLIEHFEFDLRQTIWSK